MSGTQQRGGSPAEPDRLPHRVSALETEVSHLHSSVKTISGDLKALGDKLWPAIDDVRSKLGGAGKYDLGFALTALGVLGVWTGIVVAGGVGYVRMALDPVNERIEAVDREGAIRDELAVYRARFGELDASAPAPAIKLKEGGP
ncbi:MAG: hypothetical protein WD066_18850 [Planctomycetaceae bacterium]